jgi:beta-mannanase
MKTVRWLFADKRWQMATATMAIAALAGLYTLGSGQAATYAKSSEIEDGVVKSPAAVVAATGASNGSAVKFGAGGNGALGSRIKFGIFTVEGASAGGLWTANAIYARETKLGHKLTPVQYFTDFSEPFYLSQCKELASTGHEMLISMQPQVNTQSVINGNSDAYIRQFATDAAKCPTQMYIRLYAEMNGAFTIYSPYHDRDYPNDPESTHTTSISQLVSAYRHIIDVYRSVNPNTKWVFSVNETDDSTVAANKMESYYPGDAYTDILAFDAYNWGDGGPFSMWRSPKDVYAEPYTRLTALNATLPVWVTETSSKEPLVDDGYGANPGKSKGVWIRDLFSMTDYPRIDTIVWFDIYKQSNPPVGGERDWRVDSSTDSLNALKASVQMTP